MDLFNGFAVIYLHFCALKKIQLSTTNPIKDISTHFSLSIAKIQDIFHTHKPNERNAETHLVFTMPGTTEEVLHVSIENTFKQYSLWLSSGKLSPNQKDIIGWIQDGNSTYTYPQGQATIIQDVITTMAVANPEVAALVAKIKGEQFIFSRSGKI